MRQQQGLDVGLTRRELALITLRNSGPDIIKVCECVYKRAIVVKAAFLANTSGNNHYFWTFVEPTAPPTVVRKHTEWLRRNQKRGVA